MKMSAPADISAYQKVLPSGCADGVLARTDAQTFGNQAGMSKKPCEQREQGDLRIRAASARVRQHGAIGFLFFRYFLYNFRMDIFQKTLCNG